MPQTIAISREDIIQQVKLSCQISSIIERIVTRNVLLAAAAEANLKVEADELQQTADNIRLMSNLKTADETWVWLQKNALSLDDFEEMVYTNLISNKLATHLFANQVEPWFFEHQLEYAGAAIYEVILDDEDLAMELFYSLQEGEITFAEVAHQYIQEKELRRAGGYRGIVRRSQLKPEISAAVFAAKPPQILKPILTSKGAHLIWVEEIVQPQLDDKLRSQILSDLFAAWLKQRIEEVEVIANLEANV